MIPSVWQLFIDKSVWHWQWFIFVNPIQHSFALLHPLKTWKNLKIFWRFQGAIAVQNWAEMSYSFINFLKKFTIVSCFTLCLKCWSTLYCSWLLICLVSNNRAFLFKTLFSMVDLLRKSSRYRAKYNDETMKRFLKAKKFEIAMFEITSTNHRKFITESSEDLRLCSTWLRDKQHSR